MAVRISGLVSGLDTDSIVQELVNAYSTKKEKYEKAQTKLDWSMNAWKEVNTKVYDFYSTSLSSMRYSSAYSVKKSSSSNTSVATVTASSDAVSGTQSLSVSKLAASGYLTGGVISTSAGDKVTGNTKLSEMGDIGNGSIRVNGTEVKFSGDTTISELISKMKGAGVSANFDANTQRIFISSKASGEANEFTVTAGDDEGLEALQTLGLFSAKDINGNETADMKYYRNLVSADRDTVLADRLKAAQYTEKTYKSYIEAQKKSSESAKASAQKQLDELNKDDYDWSEKYKTEEEYNKAKTSLEEKIAEYDSKISSYDNILNDEAAFAEAMQKANDEIEANVTASLDNEIAIANKILNDSTLVNSTDSARITASDAQITLNGATFTSTTNAFSINGLNINVTGTTTSEVENAEGGVTIVDNPVTLTTSIDTQGIYDKIKSMFTAYNEMISYMDGLYYADSAEGYEPLTDDEKESMTDTQIEKWEEKIKGALLRRDSTLGDLSSAMKTAILQTKTEYNGKSYDLSSFGISTLGYFTSDKAQRGTFHIDGDSSDKNTSANTDKLMAAISEDPDAVADYFQKLSQNLYSVLTKKMSSSSLSSAFTIYNDKQMSSQYSDYTDKVKEWEDRLSDYEDFYYKKFSAMESALSKLQSQTTALSNLLGG